MYLFLILSLSEAAREGSTTEVKKGKPRREHNSEIAELPQASGSLKRGCEIKDSVKKVPDLTKNRTPGEAGEGRQIATQQDGSMAGSSRDQHFLGPPAQEGLAVCPRWDGDTGQACPSPTLRAPAAGWLLRTRGHGHVSALESLRLGEDGQIKVTQRSGVTSG